MRGGGLTAARRRLRKKGSPVGPHAGIISQWSFNSDPPDGDPGSGTLIPSFGYGTISFLNGITNNFSDGSSNDPAPIADDSAISTSRYPAQGTNNKTAGVQFNLSTVGYSN